MSRTRRNIYNKNCRPIWYGRYYHDWFDTDGNLIDPDYEYHYQKGGKWIKGPLRTEYWSRDGRMNYSSVKKYYKRLTAKKLRCVHKNVTKKSVVDDGDQVTIHSKMVQDIAWYLW